MGDKKDDRLKAIGLLAVALVVFLGAMVIGYLYSELFTGVGAGLIVLAVAGIAAYNLWWKAPK